MGLLTLDHCVQEDAGIKKETMKQFYVVNDMYDFDNIGFTKSVDNNTIKYLICADCEVGPLGWHCISSKKNFVALARVKHVWSCMNFGNKPMILFFLQKKKTKFQSIWTSFDHVLTNSNKFQPIWTISEKITQFGWVFTNWDKSRQIWKQTILTKCLNKWCEMAVPILDSRASLSFQGTDYILLHGFWNREVWVPLLANQLTLLVETRGQVVLGVVDMCQLLLITIRGRC